MISTLTRAADALNWGLQVFVETYEPEILNDILKIKRERYEKEFLKRHPDGWGFGCS
jgi:hypothetical protein